MTKNHEYNVGLVLSGGGFRGVAHIGVLKALEEHGIKANIVSGVSAGALVGACYAAGLSCEMILSLFKKPKLFSINHYSYKKAGLLDSDKFLVYLHDFIKQETFEELDIPLYISATDMLTGKLITFSQGKLDKTVMASCAFPFIFSPVWYENTFYSDGGIINNFPVEPLLGRCKTIIGVYVNPLNDIQTDEINTSVKVLQRAFTISNATTPYLKFRHCDMVIEPKALTKYNLFDRKNIQNIYELGYEEGSRMLEKMKNQEISF